MKKIAIFSDIHGNLEALQSILEDINSKDYDEIIFLGDAISIGPQSKECLTLLRNSNVIFILGNHEIYYLDGVEIDYEISIDKKKHLKWVKSLLDETDEEYLKKCSLFYEMTIDNTNNKILFAHFLIKDLNDSYPFEDNRLERDINQWLKHNKEYAHIFIGHEHKALSEDDVQGANGDFEKTTGVVSNIWIVGSAGCTKDNITSYTSLEVGESVSITRVYLTYDRETFLNKSRSITIPHKG